MTASCCVDISRSDEAFRAHRARIHCKLIEFLRLFNFFADLFMTSDRSVMSQIMAGKFRNSKKTVEFILLIFSLNNKKTSHKRTLNSKLIKIQSTRIQMKTWKTGIFKKCVTRTKC